MPSATPLATSLLRLQIDTYFDVIAMTVLVYDYILTLEAEQRLIWRSKWNLMKVLFFLNRYPVFADSAMVVYHQVGGNLSPGICSAMYAATGWMFWYGILVAELILVVRTWAIWGRRTSIGVVLSICITIIYVFVAYFLNSFLHSMRFEIAQDISAGLRGCIITASGNTVYLCFVLILSFETIVLALTVMRGIGQFRMNTSPIVISLYRDGILFYVYMFAISVINVTVVLAAPREFSILITALQRNLHSILSSRLLINLREASLEGKILINGKLSTGRSSTAYSSSFSSNGVYNILRVDDGHWASGRTAQSTTLRTLGDDCSFEMNPIRHAM